MGWRFSLKVPLLRRRTVWWPTWIGWALIAAAIAIPGVWWSLSGESFLSLTDRLPAEVLVVEGWIGYDGVRPPRRNSSGVVTHTSSRAAERILAVGTRILQVSREMAERELIRSGVPKDRVIAAPSKFTESGRTYESALAVFHALRARDVRPKALNVFTFGPHATAQPFGFRQG